MTLQLVPTTRGTSNRNARGSSYARRARRAWIISNYAADVPGFARCYRCGVLLMNPDAVESFPAADAMRPGLYIAATDTVTPTVMDYDPTTGVGMVSYRAALRTFRSLTVDRIIPGCDGGTYRRNNIRPACARCNSETGGDLRG